MGRFNKDITKFGARVPKLNEVWIINKNQEEIIITEVKNNLVSYRLKETDCEQIITINQDIEDFVFTCSPVDGGENDKKILKMSEMMEKIKKA